MPRKKKKKKKKKFSIFLVLSFNSRAVSCQKQTSCGSLKYHSWLAKVSPVLLSGPGKCTFSVDRFSGLEISLSISAGQTLLLHQCHVNIAIITVLVSSFKTNKVLKTLFMYIAGNVTYVYSAYKHSSHCALTDKQKHNNEFKQKVKQKARNKIE